MSQTVTGEEEEEEEGGGGSLMSFLWIWNGFEMIGVCFSIVTHIHITQI
jgi:hypothetical protein